MPWVRTPDTFPDDPRVIRAGSRAAWLFMAALHFSNRNLLDGRIEARALRRLVEDDDVEDLADALVRERLLVEVKHGYRICKDIQELQPTREKVEAERRQKTDRQRRWRENKQARGRLVDASTGASVDASQDAAPPRPAPKGRGSGLRPSPHPAEPPRCEHGRRLAADGAGCALCDQAPLMEVS